MVSALLIEREQTRVGLMVAPCILIIEDDDAIQELVHTALDYAGFLVLDAGNGQHALTLLDTYYPALIYLDMHMPVMDGWEFLAAYYARLGPHVPILAVSAYAADPASIPRVAAFIAKPFALVPMVELIQSLVAKAARSAQSPALG
jgi:two-component system, cell cycle response regulator CpdR